MLDPKTLDEMARKFTANLPEGVQQFQREVEQNVRASLQAGFSRLDLVTREEFDAQARVLARTRAQLEELTQRVEALEAAAAGGGDAAAPAGEKPQDTQGQDKKA
ncbi:ubiquinone biosynthesis accessory factor UbiK [Alkalilimnicola ehrlichii MLHE-1]|uniref:Ubiquinone biosynthesis accessory factor UbiK n=1 Tax=Alkalilimnicola ehrlichii (strain ATCC BAA-1101 / DSM 17681 / MLHE-1) TaxID=187272 RepID=Q0ACJ9_ALKEH|nr:accessory factor UbiK family protein [Alkalilimnicola ehrlichii]ABI55438.1 protein of unknown function DUF526 [Alkalilimnicola ehrlichii MLHE-1]